MNTTTYTTQKKDLRAVLDILILALLKKKPMHGFEIIEIIFKRFNLFLGSSSLYPILYQHSKQGFLKVERNKKKKIYRITKKGIKYLSFRLRAMEKLINEIKTPRLH